LDISEVERVLKSTKFLPLPRHVIIIDEPVTKNFSHYVVHYAGLTPKWRRDTIILTSLADEETVLHELAHSALGAGELLATLFGKVMKFKSRFTLIPRPLKFQYVEAKSPHPKMKHYLLKVESNFPIVDKILTKPREVDDGGGR